MKTPLAALLFALSLALPARASAQRRVGFREAIERASGLAPGALSAAQRVRAARADAQGAGRWPAENPSLVVDGEHELADDPSRVLGVGLQQRFEWPGLALARGAQAQASVRAQQGQGEAAVLDAQRAGALAWIDADLARRSLAVWDSLAAQYAELVRALQQSEQAGQSSAQSTLLAALDLGGVEASQAEARAQWARARAQLALALAEDRAASIDVGDVSDEGEPPGPHALDEEGSLRAALARRPELAALRAELDEATHRGRAAELTLVPAPTVSLGMRFDRMVIDPGEVRPGSDGRVGTSGADHRSVLVSGAVSVPLPVFDRNLAERARASADRASASENLALATRRVRLELESLRAVELAAHDAWRRWEGRRPMLAEASRLARLGFERGQVGRVETLLSFERVARGELALLRARAEYLRAWTEYARALGEVRP